MQTKLGFLTRVGLRRFGVLLALAVPVVVLAQTAQHTQVQQLLKAGQNQQALSAVEAAIAASPRDPQLQFLKASAQTALQQTEQAEQTLGQLIAQYPELPEPYNNLAVLKASKGQLLEAQTLLNQAIQNQPDYAQAYENLADVQVRLAVENLKHAQSLQASAQRQSKLEAIHTVIQSSKP